MSSKVLPLKVVEGSVEALSRDQMLAIQAIYEQAVDAINRIGVAYLKWSEISVQQETAYEAFYSAHRKADYHVKTLHSLCEELGVGLEIQTPEDGQAQVVGKGGSFEEGEWTPSALCW